MKELLRFTLRAISVLLLISIVSTTESFSQIQNRVTCDGNGSVTVSLYPVVPSPVLSASTRSVLKGNVEKLLTAINQSASLSTSVIDRDAGLSLAEIIPDYCTRRLHYNLLLLPSGNDYLIRGVQMLSGENGNEQRPQLSINLDSDGKIIGVRLVEQEERDTLRDVLRNELDDAEKERVLSLLESLEDAYNQSTIDEAESRLRAVLLSRDGSGQSQVEYTGLRGDTPYERRVNAQVYIRSLKSLMQANGVTEVTYEMINIYSRRDAEGNPMDKEYYVTLIQHFNYKNQGYQDTDFIAFHVDLDKDQIMLRRGGRGAFILTSTPPGMAVKSINDETNLHADVDLTPHFFKNIALQYHYIELGDIWFETQLDSVSPDEMLFNRNTVYENLTTHSAQMTHMDARVKVDIVRPDGGSVDEAELLVFNETANGFSSGDSVDVMAADLISTVPNYDGTFYPGETREGVFEARLEHYEPQAKTITLYAPHGNHVVFEMQRLQGEMIVRSDPDASDYAVSLASVPSFETRTGLTEDRLTLDVTGDRDPYEVRVAHPDHIPLTADAPVHGSTSAQDYIQPIPEYRMAEVSVGEPTVVDVALMPLYVQHNTDKGMLDITQIDRSEGEVSVDYTLVDHDERNRKYRVSLALMAGEEVLVEAESEDVRCANEEIPCLGKGLRQGVRGLVFDLAGMQSRLPDGYEDVHPVLTLSRKKGCSWACVLIPAAAGAAAAYIWPRTGKHDDPTFIPPPRP